MNIREQLESLAEPGFQQFMAKLIPNIESKRIIGVRLPVLRKMAKQIAEEDWKYYLEKYSSESYEEVMLQGMIIGYIKEDIGEILRLIEQFLPKIDNWSTCDSFCAGLKQTKKYPEEMWRFISKYIYDQRAYFVRFSIVMIIFYYIDEKHIEKVFAHFDRICHTDYYVKMAIAWAVSICFIKMPERTMTYLKKNNLDDFTYHKALQKIRESRKVNKETKEKIKNMMRK
ncbi:DNA alkylation repair protein [Faecalimonas sp.]